MAHHAYMVSHQHAIYIYVSPNSLLASPTHLFVSCLDFFCSPFVVDVYFVVTLSREPGASTFQHDIIGKVHSRAIPVSWKKRPVFSTGSQDSPPVSLV